MKGIEYKISFVFISFKTKALPLADKQYLPRKVDTFVFSRINSFVINITPFTINNGYLLYLVFYIMSIFFCKTLQLCELSFEIPFKA